MSFFTRVAGKIKKELTRLQKNRLEIILYHFVTSKADVFTGLSHNVAPAVFSEQLRYLSEHYHVVPLSQANEIIRRGGGDGPYVSVCFDDGYASNITEAYPILQAHRFPAALFICPSVIDNHDILWRDKIRYLINSNLTEKFVDFLKQSVHAEKYDFAMLAKKNFYAWSKKEVAITDMSIQNDLNDFFNLHGIYPKETAEKFNLYIKADDIKAYEYLEFGNHTWSHPLLSCLDCAQQAAEIRQSHEYLTRHDVAPFCLSLPFAPYNLDTLKLCRELNYAFILDVSNEGNVIHQARGDFLILHRKMAPTTLAGLKKMI